MHILYLHQYFVPPDGKGATRSYEVAKRMVQRGHKVTMITSSAAFPPGYEFGSGANFLSIDGIDVRVLDVPYSNRLSYAQRLRAFVDFALRSTVQALREKDVDVVFATSTPLTIAIPAIAGKFRHRCPMIFEVRDLWPELPIAVGALKNPLIIRLARLLEATAYRNAVRVVALSPGMAAGIEATGYPRERIATIPNACDIDLFRVGEEAGQDFLRRHPFLQGGPIVAYCGTIGIINGVEYLVQLAERMREKYPAVRFMIAGDGFRREAVITEARSRGVLEKNLWFFPPVAKREVPALLSASTVAVSLFIDLPPMWNNSANKFFDALAASRPVAINYSGWQADFLEKSGSGVVLPARDIDAAAGFLGRALYDDVFLNQARRAAAHAADTIFNRDLLAHKICDMLEQMVDKNLAGAKITTG